jgi:DNA-binding GntR family transcriptional regulator
VVVPLQTLSVVDAVAADLRTNLFTGEFQVDRQLTEAEVAATYGVARPTAKAAIEKLVSEGLLQRRTHKTARVPVMSAEDVRDLYLARSCIELEVVRRLARSGASMADAVTANAEVLAADEEATGGPDIIAPTAGFHLALVGSLQSPRLDRVFRTVMGEMRLCMAQMRSRKLLRRDLIVEEHWAILACIDNGDADGAAAAMQAHLINAQNRLVPELEDGRPAGSPSEPEPRGVTR